MIYWKKRDSLFLLVLIVLDQLTKLLAVLYLKNRPSVSLIPGVLELTYLENYGAAWGILENARWLFLVLAAGMLAVLFYAGRRMSAIFHRKWLPCCCFLEALAAGTVGNALDRLKDGYVIDFINFTLIDFPVFNLADCYITVSIVLFLVVYRKEVIAWLKS